MLDLTYVRTKKRRKIVAAISIIASVCIMVLAVVGLLARQPGSFTVSLNRGAVNMALSKRENGDDARPYLSEKSVTSYEEYTFNAFSEYGGIEYFDNPDREGPAAIIGEDGKAKISFFKYTFYVINKGDINVDYDLSLNMTQIGANTTSVKGLESTLRVAYFENYNHTVVVDEETTEKYSINDHNYKVYAYSNHRVDPTRNEHGQLTFPAEPITQDSPLDLAEPFVTNKIVLKSTVSGLLPQQKVRCTLVVWIEGSDLDSQGDYPNNTIRLGVSINATESEKEN